MYYTRYENNIAPIILVGDDNGLSILYFDIEEAKNKLEIKDGWEYKEQIFADTIKQLDEYFAGSRREFFVKLNPKGTEYQRRVWDELKKIPYGQKCSYKDIAENMGSPKSSRAVGNANGKNPIPLIVPCHRVVGSNNKLTGFAFGLDLKKKLIDFEHSNI